MVSPYSYATKRRSPFDMLRMNGEKLSATKRPFVLSLSKHEQPYREDVP